MACFVVTLVTCGWLWRHQASVAPFAIGEVRGDAVVVRSPCDGEVLAVGGGESAEPLFAEVEQGATSARIKNADADGEIIDVAAPLTGRIAAAAARPGEFVQKGDPLLTIASPEATYILCHVPDHGQNQPAIGATVAIRRQARGAGWVPTVVEAIGPALEPPPFPQNGAVRALPVRLALPKDFSLAPGSLVDVRFSPADSSL